MGHCIPATLEILKSGFPNTMAKAPLKGPSTLARGGQ